MTSFLTILPTEGWTRLLIDAMWQSTLIASMGLIVARFATPQPSARAWILLAAISGCVAAPLASATARGTGWTFFVLPRMATSVQAVGKEVVAELQPDVINATRYLLKGEPIPSRPVEQLKTSFPRIRVSGTELFASLWAVFTATLSARLLWSILSLHRLMRSAQSCHDQVVIAAAEASSQQLGLSCAPRLLLSDRVTMPMVSAFMQPTLLLPTDYASMLAEVDWKASFTHELAHVGRLDGWTRLGVRLVNVFVPLQPLLWFAARRHHAACEEACDDWAVASGNHPVELARTLTAWMSRPAVRGFTAAIGMSSNRCRALRLLDVRYAPSVKSSPALLGVAGLALALLVAGIAVAQLSAPEAKPGTESPADATSAGGDQSPMSITGKCTDEGGKPYVDVRVRLFKVGFVDGIPFQWQLAETTSGSDGSFRIDAIFEQPAGSKFYLVAIATYPGRATATARPSGAPLVLVLPLGAALHGRITDANGKPIANASVWAPNTGLVEPVAGICAAETDADGQYEIGDLKPYDLAKQAPRAVGNGAFVVSTGSRLNIRHPDYARQLANYTKVPSTVDVTLGRAAVVEGIVTLPDGLHPVVGERVEFYCDAVSPDYWTRCVTDGNGHYRIGQLPPGKYRLSVAHAGQPNLFRQNVELKEGSNTVNLQFQAGGVVKGRVIDVGTGLPVVGEQMSISPHEHGEWHAGMPSANVHSDGTFELILPAGKAFLGMYIGPNWRGVNTDALFRGGVDVVAGQTMNLEIRVKRRSADDDKPPAPLSAQEAAQVSEQAAIAAIKSLGGWAKTEAIDGHDHVVEVNMVYHEDEEQGRQENRILSDECLYYVRKFPKLKGLFLYRTQATDDALAHLDEMENLETVLIWDASAISDAGVAILTTKLPNLKSVHISNSKIGDESLKHFSKLHKLESLSLQGNHFTDQGLAYLAGMTQLQVLSLGLGENEITDDGLKNLSGLAQLKQLDLQRSKITDAGLTHLRGLKKLERFFYSGSKVTDEGFRELCRDIPALSPPASR